MTSIFCGELALFDEMIHLKITTLLLIYCNDNWWKGSVQYILLNTWWTVPSSGQVFPEGRFLTENVYLKFSFYLKLGPATEQLP